MLILDCSGPDAALQSLAAGFQCSVETLIGVLTSLDLDNIYETDTRIMVAPEEFLYRYVCRQLGGPVTYTHAYWFHGTRTSPGNTFSSGLHDLGQSEKLVMEMMISHAPDPEVKSRLQAWNVHSGVPDTMFMLRTQNKEHWGPYGHLVRETHFYAGKLFLHDYARLPELIGDICNAYKKKYDQDLTEHYLQRLLPCIVWFIADIEHQQSVLENALGYAYNSVRELPPDSLSVNGIDCKGTAVPYTNIIRVEYLSG